MVRGGVGSAPAAQSAAAQRVPASWRMIDATVAAAVFLYNLPVQGIVGATPLFPAVLVPISLCLPYLWRRDRPVGAFAATLGAACLHLAAGVGLVVADLMIVLTLAGLASRRPRPVSLPALGGSLVWVVLVVSLHGAENALSVADVGILLLLPVTAWLIGRATRARRTRLDDLRERNRTLERERDTQRRIAAAEERTRIAREIHDVVSHSLSAVTLLADGAAATVETDPRGAREAMLTVRDTSREAMSQMRSMLSVLRSTSDADRGPQPGLDDLDDLVAQARGTGLPARLVVRGERGHLSTGRQLTLYRVVQEALTNVRRHATGVTEAEVRLAYRDDQVEVTVTNDGRSVSPGPSDGTGHGLLGMRERVAAHDGTVLAGPCGTGFRVQAVIPRGSVR